MAKIFRENSHQNEESKRILTKISRQDHQLIMESALGRHIALLHKAAPITRFSTCLDNGHVQYIAELGKFLRSTCVPLLSVLVKDAKLQIVEYGTTL